MPGIKENIEKITSQLPAGVRLVAVSKFHPVEKLREAYDAGQRLFGENHAQELVAKAPLMPADVSWHFIGHLQSNKVRAIMPSVSVIESIDTIKLLHLVNKEAQRIGRTVDVLLQLHVAQEETKSGFSVDEILEAAGNGEFSGFDNVRICGLMAMATNTPDTAQVAQEFATVRSTFDKLKSSYFAGNAAFREISMGMSDDWHIAVEHGSTMVRIGTAVFGPREY
jgi:PLP dependent protein